MNIVIRLILIIALFWISGCQRKGASDGNPQVALVMKTLNNPFFMNMQNGAEKSAKKLGIDLIVQAPEREVDVEKQMQIVENLIQRNIDVICITPSGSREIIPAILKANRADIPVIIVDSRIDEVLLEESGGHITSFIGSDNIEGGQIAGKYINQRLGGRGKIAVLEGIPGHETGDARLKGFHNIIDQTGGIEIVASQTANWERDQGYNVFQNILQSHPDIRALFACNDMMALGAIEAISAVGKTGDIIVVGFDAVKDALEAIKSGRMDASVAQHPYDMGKIAIEKARDLLNGKTIPKEIPVTIELITRESLVSPQQD